MRGLRVGIAGTVVGCAVIAAACSLDEGGERPADGAAPDVFVPDVVPPIDAPADWFTPPPCADPDASLDAACLGVPLPPGWTPVAVQLDASTVSCGDDGGDFGVVTGWTNATVTGNSCVCKPCVATSDWSCNGNVGVGASVCTTTTQSEGNTAACFVASGTVFGGTMTTTPATCAGAGYYSEAASANAIAGCAPKRCESDFCALAGHGFELCAQNPAVTDGGCPSGFTKSYVVGGNPHADCNACPTCGLANPGATCTATLTAYDRASCDGGVLGTASADGSCNAETNTGADIASVLYQPTKPPLACDPSGPTNVGGQGAVDAPITICCVQ